jgi:hypothetical protein
MDQNNFDDDWLEALAGRPRPGADRRATQEALAVRRALIAMRKDAAAGGETAAERVELEKTLFLLKREGLLRDEPTRSSSDPEAVQDSQFVLNDIVVSRSGTQGPRVDHLRRNTPWKGRPWAIAASILAATAVALQIPYEDDESWERHSVMQRVAQGESGPLTRGAAAETVVVTPQPRQRLDELSQGLTRLGVKFDVKESKRGDIRMRIESSLPALGYLEAQHITAPQVAAGWIYLRISAPK